MLGSILLGFIRETNRFFDQPGQDRDDPFLRLGVEALPDVLFHVEPKGQLPLHVVSPPVKRWWLLKHQPYRGERQQLYAHGEGGRAIRAGEMVAHREDDCSHPDPSMLQG